MIKPIVPEQFANDPYEVLVNPTGVFELGGPHADCGLTGRKIIVDTYGGWARHGGGAFSGKDPTKVDRSAAYAVRRVAKNVVAAGIATQVRGAGRLRDRCGPPRVGAWWRPSAPRRSTRPSSPTRCRSTSTCARPRSSSDLDLRRPIYRNTAAYGHFGRSDGDFPWESTAAAAELKKAAEALA